MRRNPHRGPIPTGLLLRSALQDAAYALAHGEHARTEHGAVLLDAVLSRGITALPEPGTRPGPLLAAWLQRDRRRLRAPVPVQRRGRTGGGGGARTRGVRNDATPSPRPVHVSPPTAADLRARLLWALERWLPPLPERRIPTMKRRNPTTRAPKKENRATKAVRRVAEAFKAGVILHWRGRTADGRRDDQGTAGYYRSGGKASHSTGTAAFAIFGTPGRGGRDATFDTAFGAADHLVEWIGVGNAIDALRVAARKHGAEYANLDTPIRWTAKVNPRRRNPERAAALAALDAARDRNARESDATYLAMHGRFPPVYTEAQRRADERATRAEAMDWRAPAVKAPGRKRNPSAIGQRVTVYFSGPMGAIGSKEGTLSAVDAHGVDFIPKGGRREHRIVTYYSPFIMVVSGWGKAKPGSGMVPVASSTPGVTVSRSLYRSHDPRWVSDFMRDVGNKYAPIAMFDHGQLVSGGG